MMYEFTEEQAYLIKRCVEQELMMNAQTDTQLSLEYCDDDDNSDDCVDELRRKLIEITRLLES